MPCCSSVERTPKFIPPAASSEVAVLFRPGHQTGVKILRFEIGTDSKDRAVRKLATRADLFSECEVTSVGNRVDSICVGRSIKEYWRIVCRRLGADGLPAPQSVEAGAPIEARFVGPPVERTEPNGIVLTTRDVEVTSSPLRTVGRMHGELVLRWPAGRTDTHPVRWEITPLLRLRPSSIVLESGDGPVERIVTLASDDGPVRVLRVSGSALSATVECSQASSRVHRLALKLEPGRAGPRGGFMAVEIGVDHPDQPQLTLGVIVLPSGPSS